MFLHINDWNFFRMNCSFKGHLPAFYILYKVGTSEPFRFFLEKNLPATGTTIAILDYICLAFWEKWLERCRSGRTGRTRNPLYGFAVSRVRIPVFPHKTVKEDGEIFQSLLFYALSGCIVIQLSCLCHDKPVPATWISQLEYKSVIP